MARSTMPALGRPKDHIMSNIVDYKALSSAGGARETVVVNDGASAGPIYTFTDGILSLKKPGTGAERASSEAAMQVLSPNPALAASIDAFGRNARQFIDGYDPEADLAFE